jgi:hypothetical protein
MSPRSCIATLLLLVASAFASSAQTFSPRTDTFTFDNTSSIVSWDGSDPNNPPYPYEMGFVDLGNQPGIGIPWQLGYLNNGYLVPCNPLVWGSDTWVVGDGTHNGDTYTRPASTSCPYFTGEYGTSGNSSNILDSFSVVVKYVRTIRRVCSRGGCHNNITDTLVGGTGEAVQSYIVADGSDPMPLCHPTPQNPCKKSQG